MPAANSRETVSHAFITLTTLLPGNVTAVTRGQQSAQATSPGTGDYHCNPRQIEAQCGRPLVPALASTDTPAQHDVTLQDTVAGLDIGTGVSAGSTVIVAFSPVRPGTCTLVCNKKLLFMECHRERGTEETPRVIPPATD